MRIKNKKQVCKISWSKLIPILIGLLIGVGFAVSIGGLI